MWFDMKTHNPPKYLLLPLTFLQLLIDLKSFKCIPKSGPTCVSDNQKISKSFTSFEKSESDSLISW